MLIAILVALGVSAGGVLVLLIGLMLLRRYKTIKHPAVFKSRVRITDVLPVASLDRVRDAMPADEVKGLGDTAIVASFTMVTGATFSAGG